MKSRTLIAGFFAMGIYKKSRFYGANPRFTSSALEN
jgi:hypothetical protein